MPNSRMANAGLSDLQRRPCGIIRIAALWALCRYRHNAHYTGAAHRLDRLPKFTRFGSEAYAREELVAEVSSAFLCAAHRIVPTIRHVDYIANWLAVLKNDNRAIFQAASMAQKASDWLLDRVQFDAATAHDVGDIAA